MAALVVKPPHPFQGRQFDLFNGSPGATFLDEFCFEQGELGFGEGIVISVSFGADGGCSPEFDDSIGVCQRHVVAAEVRVMQQPGEVV